MAEKHHEKGYEPYALDRIKPILVSTAAILGVAVFAFVAMWAMFLGLERAHLYLTDAPPPMMAHEKAHTGLLLQADPPAEFFAVHAQAQQALSSYGWVDKDAGVVHIPIARAMELSLMRGFPVRSSSP